MMHNLFFVCFCFKHKHNILVFVPRLPVDYLTLHLCNLAHTVHAQPCIPVAAAADMPTELPTGQVD